MRGSRGALVGLAAAGLVLGLAGIAIALSSEHQLVSDPIIVVGLTLGGRGSAPGSTRSGAARATASGS